jgi:hypothetical protein
MTTTGTPTAPHEATYAPCPTCHQYSHSIGEDALTEAFNYFRSMAAHPVRGTPMGFNFDEKTRDMAQILVAAVKGSHDAGCAGGDVARLRAALDRYGRPVALCGIVGGYGYCTCGFNEALASTPGAGEGERVDPAAIGRLRTFISLAGDELEGGGEAMQTFRAMCRALQPLGGEAGR